MKKTLMAGLVAVGCSAASGAQAFELHVKDIVPNQPIDSKFAFCMADGAGKTLSGGNINPEIRWVNAPEGTKSFALLVVDKDVPARFDDANQEGKTIAADFPRQDFYHWVMVNIPANISSIPEGADSTSPLESGKPIGGTAYGLRGQNDYATFMQGEFGGYDGPCPPWNDARLHHYHFQLYALSVPSVGLEGAFDGRNALEAITPHILGKQEIVGTFTTNLAIGNAVSNP